MKSTSAAVMRTIKQASFWTNLSNVIKLIEYPVNIIGNYIHSCHLNFQQFLTLIILGKVEADNAELSLVYHYFGKMFDHYANDRVILPKLQDRWDFINKDVHSLSYILTPKFALAGNFIESKLEEIGKIKDFAAARQPETAGETMDQLISYVNDLSTLPETQQNIVKSMTATQYWNIIGRGKYPQLYNCAKSLNAMTCSSASAERVWSIFGFIHKPLRNRLASEKVEKLVYLYVNAGILDEKDKNDYIFDQYSALQGEDFD